MAKKNQQKTPDILNFGNNIELLDKVTDSSISYKNKSVSSSIFYFETDTTFRSNTGWTLDAGNGNDFIDARQSSEQNILLGGNGDDVIFGGTGDDTLNGGNGDDMLSGGKGADIYALSNGNDIVTDFSPLIESIETVNIDFENFDVSVSPFFPKSILIEDGYKDLDWTNAGVVLGKDAKQAFGESGYTTVLSGAGVGFDAFFEGLQFSNPESDFDFVSGDFSSAFVTQENTIVAFDDGAEVGRLTFTSSPDKKVTVNFQSKTLTDQNGNLIDGVFSGTFSSIDTVSIDSIDGFQVAIDNFLLGYKTVDGEGDKIGVTQGFDVESYISSATNDSEGNALLQTADGTLTLVGIDAADISRDWFVEIA